MKKLLLFFIMLGALAIHGNRSFQNASVKDNNKALRKKLKLDSSCVFLEQKKEIPGIKALFYIPVGKKDTFHYAIQENDSIFLWAIVKGKKIRLVRDLKNEE